jgi:Uma2 family endonuclease
MSELLKRPETMVDVYRLLPEGTPIQVIDNEFYMSPAPNFTHFNTVDGIIDALKKAVVTKNSGRVIFAPVDVFLGDKNAIQPDIFYIDNDNSHIISENGIYGAPDIIIEVLSPGNQNADLVKKKMVYEEFGVKEYFIVNPDDQHVITYWLDNEKYQEQSTQKGRLVSRVLNAEITF